MGSRVYAIEVGGGGLHLQTIQLISPVALPSVPLWLGFSLRTTEAKRGGRERSWLSRSEMFILGENRGELL